MMENVNSLNLVRARHEVTITAVSAFPRTSLTHATSDYAVVQRVERCVARGLTASHHIVRSPCDGNMSTQTFSLVSI